MMKVRDKTQTGYKGRPTYAIDMYCPCRSCYNAHDCGYVNSQGHKVVDMHCATNYNRGCPEPKPEPQHIWRGKTCIRCGARRI